MASVLKPITRQEILLHAIANKDDEINIEPITRQELFLSEILKSVSTSPVDVNVLSVNSIEPDGTGNVEIDASGIPCTDTQGYNKANTGAYIDFLCTKIKELEASISPLKGLDSTVSEIQSNVLDLQSRVGALESPPVP